MLFQTTDHRYADKWLCKRVFFCSSEQGNPEDRSEDAAASRLLFPKRARTMAGIDGSAATPGFLSPPSYIRWNRREQNMGQKETVPAGVQMQQSKKAKSPALPGFLKNIFFSQFISPVLRSDARAARPFGLHCSCG